jgi:hypothetical protein
MVHVAVGELGHHGNEPVTLEEVDRAALGGQGLRDLARHRAQERPELERGGAHLGDFEQ